MTEEKLHRQDIDDIWALLSTREGARFFARLLAACGVFRLSYAPGDTHATAFAEGQKNVGLMVYSDLLEADPEAPLVLRRGIREREVHDEDERI